MCCEATDALLEYVRRYLRLTGLRNLNAPRRLKLRVPVLKDWLQRQGHAPLAESIPDWDPVRRPTGRWKAWEVQHLKPIMDEKAVERQAKRNLVQGEPLLQITMREQADEGKRQEAIDALSAMGSCGPHLDNDEMPNYANGEAKADGSVVTTSDNFPLLIVDDAAEAAEEAGAGAESSQDEGLTSARAVTHMMVSRVSSVRNLLLRLEPSTEVQDDALYNALQAVDHLTRQLTDGSAVLANCGLNRSVPQRAPARRQQMAWGAKSEDCGDVSSQEAALLLNASSQVSLSGSVCGSLMDVMEHSQENAAEQASDGSSPEDSASPRRVDAGERQQQQHAAAAEPEAKRRRLSISPTPETGMTGEGEGSSQRAVVEVVCDSQPEPLMSSQVDPLELMEVADAPSQETVVGA